MRRMVNIHDVESGGWEGDRLEAIFARQGELMEKYHVIEAKNGLLQTGDVPVGLHDKFGQARLKDFAWRTTEEIGEAIEAKERHPDIKDHCYEEIADALHFLVEFTILAGISPDDLVVMANGDNPLIEGDKMDKLFKCRHRWDEKIYHPIETLLLSTGGFVRDMGMACNCFKNKPWKQSQMMTDVKEFYKWVTKAWISFITLCYYQGLDAESLTTYYFGKSEVNRFRQRSNY